jgi:hypothetical protein
LSLQVAIIGFQNSRTAEGTLVSKNEITVAEQPRLLSRNGITFGIIVSMRFAKKSPNSKKEKRGTSCLLEYVRLPTRYSFGAGPVCGADGSAAKELAVRDWSFIILVSGSCFITGAVLTEFYKLE